MVVQIESPSSSAAGTEKVARLARDVPPEPPAKKKRAKRRRDSAADGGTFVSRDDCSMRWGCTRQTAVVRIREGNIPEYVFGNGKSVRYKLADIEAYENKALAAGFLKRSEQLKREETAKLATAVNQ